MQDFEKNVPFDPGYSKISFSFLSNIDFVMGDYYQLKTPHQKKFKLMQIEKSVRDLIIKSTAFYLGCLLWGGFLSSKFKDDPKEITGNYAEKLTEEEAKEVDYSTETKFILQFVESFEKDCRYHLKKSAQIPSVITEILKNYNEFVQLNSQFRGIKKTSDIKLPKALAHFSKLSEKQTDELYDKIMSTIESGKIEGLLEIGFYKD